MADKMSDNKIVKSGILALAIVVFIISLASIYFLRQRIEEPIVAGPGVTRIGMLSEYFEPLKGTPIDTEVYYLEGRRPGPTFYIGGGTHPGEPAALLSPLTYIENAVVEAGRLIIIPRSQKTGYEQTEPGRGYPPRFHILQDDGDMRWFRMGNRVMDPVHSWPNPTVYVNWPSGQTLAEGETLNLNRNWPGRPNGRPTEQLTFAIMELIRKENAVVSYDPHEAPADRPLVNSICAHEDAMDIATFSVLNMEMFWNVKVRLEASPQNLRAISHREWGDHSDTLAMLIETCSPMHGPVRGKALESLLLHAYDEFEHKAGMAGRLFTEYTSEGWPISIRVARQVQQFMEIINSWNEFNPTDQLIVRGVPDYDQIVTNGIGTYLAKVDEPEPWLFPIPGIREFFFNEGRPFWGYGAGSEYDKVKGATIPHSL